jgi:hypothetical protein
MSGRSADAASRLCRVTAQEIRTANARAAFAETLAAYPDVSFTVVTRPEGFFATVAFTFAEGGIESPVAIEISTFTKSQEFPAYALAMAVVAEALGLCPTVTAGEGYHALARVSRKGDLEPYDPNDSTDVESPASPGIAIDYNFGFSGLEDPTTLFLSLNFIAASDPAALADLIIGSAPVAEPGFATPEKRRPTAEESAKLAHNMCLAPSKPGKGTKRALSL